MQLVLILLVVINVFVVMVTKVMDIDALPFQVFTFDQTVRLKRYFHFEENFLRKTNSLVYQVLLTETIYFKINSQAIFKNLKTQLRGKI